MVTGCSDTLALAAAPAFSLRILPLLAAASRIAKLCPVIAISFPAITSNIEDFRTEWWYYTGNVTGAAGERFGFELVFFREGERHRDRMTNPPGLCRISIWRMPL